MGEAFVHQYYHILFHSPELVHRFYQDISKLGRPDGAGTLNSVSTMEVVDALPLTELFLRLVGVVCFWSMLLWGSLLLYVFV